MIGLETQMKTTRTERSNSFGFWFAILLALIAIDQLSKWLARVLQINVFRNYNFAFSLPIPGWVMFPIYIVVLILVVRYIWKTWATSAPRVRFAWLLILAGGLSNIIERIILGYVRDFIPIANGTLNVADLMIILGALLILFQRVNREQV